MSVAAIDPAFNEDEFDFGPNAPLELPEDYKPNPKKIKEGGSTKSKRQKSASTFNQKTRQYWENLGFTVEKVETLQSVNGAIVKQDFCGCFDFLAFKPGEIVLIQVSSKDKARDHLRKMLGDKEYRPGRTRRIAIDRFKECGWKMVIHWFDQPGGHGAKWVEGVEEITSETIADIDSGRRTRRVK